MLDGGGADDTVSVIDTTSNAVESQVIRVGRSPLGVAVDTATHEVYVTSSNDDTVSVISPDPSGQGLAFTSTPPANPRVGDSYRVSATGPANSPVRFSIDPSSSSDCTSSAAATRPEKCR